MAPPRQRRRPSRGMVLTLLATKTAASTLSLRPKAAIKPTISLVDYPPAPPPTEFSFDFDAMENVANAPRLLTKDEEVALARSVQRLRRCGGPARPGHRPPLGQMFRWKAPRRR